MAPSGPQFAAARGPARPVRGPRGPNRRRALSRAPPPSSPRPAAAVGAVAAAAGTSPPAARPLPASAPAPLRCLLAGAAPPGDLLPAGAPRRSGELELRRRRRLGFRAAIPIWIRSREQ